MRGEQPGPKPPICHKSCSQAALVHFIPADLTVFAAVDTKATTSLTANTGAFTAGLINARFSQNQAGCRRLSRRRRFQYWNTEVVDDRRKPRTLQVRDAPPDVGDDVDEAKLFPAGWLSNLIGEISAIQYALSLNTWRSAESNAARLIYRLTLVMTTTSL